MGKTTTARKNTVRLSLILSDELNRALEEIAGESGETKNAILRKAVAMYEVAHEARRTGKKVGIAAEKAKLETEFIGI